MARPRFGVNDNVSNAGKLAGGDNTVRSARIRNRDIGMNRRDKEKRGYEKKH
jgi:hypothetical protein